MTGEQCWQSMTLRRLTRKIKLIDNWIIKCVTWELKWFNHLPNCSAAIIWILFHLHFFTCFAIKAIKVVRECHFIISCSLFFSAPPHPVSALCRKKTLSGSNLDPFMFFIFQKSYSRSLIFRFLRTPTFYIFMTQTNLLTF